MTLCRWAGWQHTDYHTLILPHTQVAKYSIIGQAWLLETQIGSIPWLQLPGCVKTSEFVLLLWQCSGSLKMSQEQAVLFAGEGFGLVLCRMATVL